MKGYPGGSKGQSSLITALSLLLAISMPEACAQIAVRGPIDRFKRVKLSQAAGRQTQLAAPGSFQDAGALPQSFGTTNSAPVSDSKEEKKEEKRQEKQEKSRKVRGDAPCLCWVKAGVPVKAVVLCIHGLGLNSSSWEQLGKRLSEKGVVTYAIDVRGFGSWMEAKGHHNVDFKACLEDVRITLEWIHRANPGKPVFLLGESMGGAIALQATAEYPSLIDGLISACASGDRFKQKKMDLQVGLHMLAPGGMRRDFNIGSSIVEQATNNPELKAEWEGDPLNRMKLSPKELLQFQKFMNENHEKARLITKTPVLMVQGSKDGLVKPEGTEELFSELATPDKEMLMVPNGEHLIFEEGQFTEDVMRSVAFWVIRHAPQFQQAARMLGAKQRRGQRGGSARPQTGPPGSGPFGAQQQPGTFPPRPPFPRAQDKAGAIGNYATQSGAPIQADLPLAMQNMMPPGSPAVVANAAPQSQTQVAPQGTGESSAFAAVPGQFLAQAKQLLAEGKVKLAQRTLEAELQIAPNSPEANYLLGQTYLQTQNYKMAHQHLRNAIRHGAGTSDAAQANQMLMNMPRNVIAPRLASGGPDTASGGFSQGGARRQRRNGGRPAFQQQGDQTPTVIVFNAKWCEPGKDMALVVQEAQRRFPTVKFVQVDVDDPKNATMLDKYSIGPVPTTVFLDSAGGVADFCVGYAGIDGMINGMSKILPVR